MFGIIYPVFLCVKFASVLHYRGTTLILKVLTTNYIIFLGYFICPKCNIHGDWGILERLIKKAKIETTLKGLIEKFGKNSEQFDKDWRVIVDSTTSIDKLNETEVLELLRLFEYPVSI